ncbi:hypothetical protein A2U01_0071848, partial [Trifolium medium]|nr:hypothetical protein [Trifolium medium]
MPLNPNSQAYTFTKGKNMNIDYNSFELLIEQPIDFEALKVNGFEVEKFFTDQ